LDLKPGDSLLDKGVIDSTGVLELVAFLESQYAITVEDDDVIPDNLDSIENIVQFVSKKLQCPA
jgi:acyl carrier protein